MKQVKQVKQSCKEGNQFLTDFNLYLSRRPTTDELMASAALNNLLNRPVKEFAGGEEMTILVAESEK